MYFQKSHLLSKITDKIIEFNINIVEKKCYSFFRIFTEKKTCFFLGRVSINIEKLNTVLNLNQYFNQ